MKKHLSLLFLLPLGSCFGQEPGVTQFWNNYGFINPATDGTAYKHQAAITGRSDFYVPGVIPFTATAVYGTRFDKIHSGIGIHYRYLDYGGGIPDQRIGLNYNYQFRIAELVDVSVGAGLDVEEVTYPNPGPYPGNIIDRNWLPNTGFLARYKHLSVGGSLTALYQPPVEQEQVLSWGEPYTPPRRAFFHAEYTIPFGEFELTPRVLAEIRGVFQGSARFEELTTNLQATYAKLYWIGAGYQVNTEQVTAMIGWDIRGKYRVGYAYNFYVDKLSFAYGIHELTLGIQLGKI